MGIRNWLVRLGLARPAPVARPRKKRSTRRTERTEDSATVRIAVGKLEGADPDATVVISTASDPDATVMIPAAADPEATVVIPAAKDPESARSGHDAAESGGSDPMATVVVRQIETEPHRPEADSGAIGLAEERGDPDATVFVRSPEDPAAHASEATVLVATLEDPAPAAETEPEEPDPGATQYFAVETEEAPALAGVLVAIDGPLRGEIYRVEDGENLIGRENCNVRLRSGRVSRFHARVTHDRGLFTIESNPEIREQNPTLVNGDIVVVRELEDGDVILVGDCSLKFRTL